MSKEQGGSKISTTIREKQGGNHMKKRTLALLLIVTVCFMFLLAINVKAAIVQACKSAIISNPVIKEYALRLKKKGKHEGVIMNNVKNKIIHTLFKNGENQNVMESGVSTGS